MSKMVSRVARAIRKADNGEHYPLGCYTKLARAAIEAMREPTEAMLLAGHGANLCENAPEVWDAMIDEALK